MKIHYSMRCNFPPKPLEEGTIEVNRDTHGITEILTDQDNEILAYYMDTHPGTEEAILQTFHTAQPQEATLTIAPGGTAVVPRSAGYLSFCDLDFSPVH